MNIIRKKRSTPVADNLEVVTNRPDPKNLPDVARRHVFDAVKVNLEKTDLHITFSEDEVYVVWFAFILGGWKALCSTTLPDGRYYEATFNKDKQQVYIDTYLKVANVAIDVE